MGFAHRRVVCIMVATFNVLEFSSQGFLYTDPEFLSLFFFLLVTFVLCLGWIGHLHYDCAFFCFGRRVFFTLLFISFVTLGPDIDRL